MHQITLLQDKKSKNYLGRGHSPSPDSIPSREGDTPHPTPLGAYASILAPMALDTHPPLLKILDLPLLAAM